MNLRAFDEFECAYIAINFPKPTDVITGFGLERDVSSYLLTEENLDYPVAVDSFGIDIRVTVYDGSTNEPGTAQSGLTTV